MELACPKCDTHFFVADNAIGPTGRKVRCSNCEHIWHAMPTAPSAPPAARVATTSNPVPSDDEFHWPADPLARETEVPADTADYQEEPGQAYDADDRAESGSDALDEERFEEALEEHGQPEVAGESLYEADVAEVEPYEKADFSSPMASAFTTDPSADRRRRRGKKRMVLGVVILILVALTYFLRDQIVAAVPAAARLYELAHIPVAGAEAGLEIIDVQHTGATEGGLPVIRVTGFVVNRGLGPMTIPQIEVTLIAQDGTRYARKVFRAPQPLVDPATSAPFQYDIGGNASEIAKAEVRLIDGN